MAKAKPVTATVLDDAILSLEDAAEAIERWARLLDGSGWHFVGHMSRKADEIRGTIARLERNALAESGPQAREDVSR